MTGFLVTSENREERSTTDHESLLDAHTMARLLGVKPSWLLQRAREHRIPHYRIGKYIRFDPAEIRAVTRQKPDRHAD